MKITIEKQENITIACIEETRLDASIAPEFKHQMEELINQGNHQIILDMSNLGFMDSSSLGATVAVLKSMGNQGKLVISGANGVVLDLFKLTRMDRVFTLANSLEEAKEEFSVTA